MNKDARIDVGQNIKAEYFRAGKGVQRVKKTSYDGNNVSSTLVKMLHSST